MMELGTISTPAKAVRMGSHLGKILFSTHFHNSVDRFYPFVFDYSYSCGINPFSPSL